MFNPKNDRHLQTELHIASIELIRNYNFYGHILVQLPKIFLSEDSKAGKELSTLAVGKDSVDDMLIKMYINMGYLRQIYTENEFTKAAIHLLESVKHEIIHIVFNHLSIYLPDKIRSNVAADLSVNSYCIKDNFLTYTNPETKMKDSQMLFPEDYGFESKKSFLWYYNNLLNNEKFQNQCKKGMFGINGFYSDSVSAHDRWGAFKDDPMAAEFIRDIVRKAHHICKENNDYGNVPGDIIEQLTGLCGYRQAILPWQSILKMFISSAMENVLSYTVKRRSKRFGTRPGTKKEDILNLAIGIDTSGSVSNEQLVMFFNELYAIHKSGAKITIFECDTKIAKDPYPFEKFNKKVQGRGGTDLEPVLKAVEDAKYDALIFFTDFATPEIKKQYHIPILWVLSNCYMKKEDFPYKWGKYLKINHDNSMEVVK